MKEIRLTQGKVALVDDEDYERLIQYKWQAEYSQNARTWYAKRRAPMRGKTIRMHREIMQPDDRSQVDHRNHDGLDNRRQNLRVCTNGLNIRNTRKRRGCVSPYKGVCFCKSTGRWMAQIVLDGKGRKLGRFDTQEEAAAAYAARARKEFGDFACVEGAP